MRKIIIVSFLLCNCNILWGQSFPGQKEYLNRLQKESSKLYEYENRLYEIQEQIQSITLSYRQKQIDQEELEQQMTPLLKEEIQIKNDPIYIIQQRLYELIRSQKVENSLKSHSSQEKR